MSSAFFTSSASRSAMLPRARTPALNTASASEPGLSATSNRFATDAASETSVATAWAPVSASSGASLSTLRAARMTRNPRAQAAAPAMRSSPALLRR